MVRYYKMMDYFNDKKIEDMSRVELEVVMLHMRDYIDHLERCLAQYDRIINKLNKNEDETTLDRYKRFND